jgi:hypothetical protein
MTRSPRMAAPQAGTPFFASGHESCQVNRKTFHGVFFYSAWRPMGLVLRSSKASGRMLRPHRLRWLRARSRTKLSRKVHSSATGVAFSRRRTPAKRSRGKSARRAGAPCLRKRPETAGHRLASWVGRSGIGVSGLFGCAAYQARFQLNNGARYLGSVVDLNLQRALHPAYPLGRACNRNCAIGSVLRGHFALQSHDTIIVGVDIDV